MKELVTKLKVDNDRLSRELYVISQINQRNINVIEKLQEEKENFRVKHEEIKQ